jgi:hypothetical protein
VHTKIFEASGWQMREATSKSLSKSFFKSSENIESGKFGPRSLRASRFRIMAKKTPMRLRYLRVKSDKSSSLTDTKACNEELNNLITCWRVNGVDSVPCLSAMQALAFCSSVAVSPCRTLVGSSSHKFRWLHPKPSLSRRSTTFFLKCII